MWADNETDKDFLNFTGVAETVAEIIVQAQSKPISIGVSGAWGVGKSSMIKLIRQSLEHRDNPEKRENGKFIFVEFNAWLYQGYDDARAALMEVIGEKLTQEAGRRKKGIEKAKEFLERIRWIRLAKLVAGSAVAIHAGLPPVGLIGELYGIGKHFLSGEITSETAEAAVKAAGDAKEIAAELLDPKKKQSSPPQEIQALRDSFEKTLEAMEVTLVVLIDDLDRCLPETTISTLEAIRLVLFLKNTAFVIAADDGMIKYAVRRHFPDVTDELAINYFDKLIQVPIRVPPLGTQEVRGYMMLLYVDNSDLDDTVKEKIRTGICKQLGQTWQGKRVDRNFIQTLHDKFSHELIARLDSADRLAHVMTTATRIAGNPRLIKRFLNALSIRMAIAKSNGVGVDETVLAKMLLFERVGNSKAYSALIKEVTESVDGKPAFLADWERAAIDGQHLQLPEPWDDPFVEEWLALEPHLADHDLRGVLYVSREHAPLITAQDRLSSEAAELLAALLQHPEGAASLRDRLDKLARNETAVLMDRLLEQARKEQQWGVPPILEACLVVATADAAQGQRLAAFLLEVPAAQIKPNIIPKITGEPWAESVFEKWNHMQGISAPVKRAMGQKKVMAQGGGHGNFSL